MKLTQSRETLAWETEPELIKYGTSGPLTLQVLEIVMGRLFTVSDNLGHPFTVIFSEKVTLQVKLPYQIITMYLKILK